LTPKRLATLVVEAKLVSRLVIDRVLTSLDTHETLADALVDGGLVQEPDLLKLVAHHENTRFVSSARLAQHMTPADVLKRLAPEHALTWQVLPLTYDKAGQQLTVAAASVTCAAQLRTLPTLAGLSVQVYVALPSALNQAIERLYQRRAPTPLPTTPCAGCGAATVEGQLECARCGRLLELGRPDEASLVRALLVVPTGEHRIPRMAAVLEGPTRKVLPPSWADETRLRLTADLSAVRTLSELEAFIISSMTATSTVGGLIEASGLSGYEGRTLLSSLFSRGLISLETPPAVLLKPIAEKPAPVLRAAPALSVAPLRQPTKRLSPSPDAALLERQQTENSIQAALNLERRGEVDGALKVLHIAIARTSRPAPLFNRLALVLAGKRRDFREAESLLKKAIALEPNDPVYAENLAKVLMAAASAKKR
jgi:tetratricopeptide (TPR) repeat protein